MIKICKNCGQELPATFTFCSLCKEALIVSQPPKMPKPSQTATTPQYYANARTSQYVNISKSRIKVYVVPAIILVLTMTLIFTYLFIAKLNRETSNTYDSQLFMSVSAEPEPSQKQENVFYIADEEISERKIKEESNTIERAPNPAPTPTPVPKQTPTQITQAPLPTPAPIREQTPTPQPTPAPQPTLAPTPAPSPEPQVQLLPEPILIEIPEQESTPKPEELPELTAEEE